MSTDTRPSIKSQEIFDKVFAHLLKQGCRAMEGQSCRYRARPSPGSDGQVLSCAIGALIPDELYNPAIEGRGSAAPAVLAALPFEPTNKQIGLMSELQTIHDGGRGDGELFRERVIRLMKDTASIYGLQYRIPETV